MSDFRFTTAGESHGPGLVAIVEGMPAGLQLDRRARNGHAAFISSGNFARGKRQQWTHPLAAAQRRIAHCLVQALRRHLAARQYRLQLRFDALLVCGRPSFEISRRRHRQNSSKRRLRGP